MKNKIKISAGLYLVIDPSREEKELLGALSKALEAKPCALQIWDNFQSNADVPALLYKIKLICNTANVPLLINNHPEWVEHFDLDGVHLDDLAQLSEDLLDSFSVQNKIVGITANNDLTMIRKAIEAGVDYLSFCSMFPSETNTSCELVNFETVRKTREITAIPIFLAGGISLKNIKKLQNLQFDGIAVVSGVMSAADPAAAIKDYQRSLSTRKK